MNTKPERKLIYLCEEHAPNLILAIRVYNEVCKICGKPAEYAVWEDKYDRNQTAS
jgi:hypothetical protein